MALGGSLGAALGVGQSIEAGGLLGFDSAADGTGDVLSLQLTIETGLGCGRRVELGHGRDFALGKKKSERARARVKLKALTANALGANWGNAWAAGFRE